MIYAQKGTYEYSTFVIEESIVNTSSLPLQGFTGGSPVSESLRSELAYTLKDLSRLTRLSRTDCADRYEPFFVSERANVRLVTPGSQDRWLAFQPFRRMSWPL